MKGFRLSFRNRKFVFPEATKPAEKAESYFVNLKKNPLVTVPRTVASIVVAGEDTPLHLCALEHESPALVSHVLQDTPAYHQQLTGCRYNLNGKSPFNLYVKKDNKI